MKFKSEKEIAEFLRPIADREGVELVDVEVKLSKNPSLTVFIETEDGVDLDTLERFHNAIDAPLDEFDPSFSQPYTLNVSSPGLDRPFKTDRDYERNLGLDVEVRLYAPIKGQKFFEGTLVGYDGNTLTLLTNDGETKFELSRVAKTNCAVKFDD
ncbi:MAG: ribosome maturation factor RimP [Clostridia bacterium]|nr:ribosome maturation factor RimP [Clostridia bacterium]